MMKKSFNSTKNSFLHSSISFISSLTWLILLSSENPILMATLRGAPVNGSASCKQFIEKTVPNPPYPT